MKKHRLLLVGTLALLGLWARGADSWVRYGAEPAGSRVKVEGSSTVHDWSVESRLIGGYVEFDPAFDLDKPQPGKVNARVAVIIPVRQLKSDKTAMDNVMYDAMKEKEYRRIDYRLSELTLKEAPKSPDAPFVFDTKGELVVAGATNKIEMPVTMTRVAKDKLKFTGSTSVKMTSFGIQPPAPKIALGLISTSDDVKLTFEWLTARKEPAGK
jgi:polyisoprenoid-binding protein YceI